MKTIIVAGITRSGLTLTMQMLNAGGFPCVGEYPSFENDFVDYSDFKGKAIKAVDTHQNFPPKGEYYVIRLRRNFTQQAKSQVKFLQFLGVPVRNKEWKQLMKGNIKDYKKIDFWKRRQMAYLDVYFEDLIQKPKVIAQEIAEFIDEPLKISDMRDVVITRSTQCYDGLLELKLLNA